MDKLLHFAKIAGLIMVVIGTAIQYIISRRRFNRRAITGLQIFKSYEQAWTTKWLERIGQFIAIFLIAVGIILFIGSTLPRP